MMTDHNTKKRIEETLANLETLVGQLRVLEKEVVESEERFRMVAEFAYDWEYWQDIDGNFIYVSPSAESVTGYTPEEFSQDKGLMKKIIHLDDWERWQTHSHEMLENGEVEPIEFRIKTKFGDTRWIHHVCRTVTSQDGESRGIRGSNRDITQQKNLQEEIKVLKGFLPICASCKKIRDDKGYWTQIESYIREHSEAEFSHGICPECAQKLYPGFYDKRTKSDRKKD
ncbi:MAG: PAS domain S-box protein [Desulfobulbaceae bacterium]|nr:PAS domain S-box protein [Desulfobulbaceae bacterium]